METLMLAAVLLLAGQAGPEPARFTPVPAAEAIAYFRRVCFDTMPDPGAFARAFPGGIAWEPTEKPARAAGVAGNFFRSSRGELDYVYLPGATALDRTPSCRYSFPTRPDYRHADAAAALARTLRLDRGRRTGAGRAPETRWERRLANGARVWLTLSSGVAGLGVPAAALTVTAYPSPPGPG